MSRDDVCMSAETTMTRAVGSISCSLASTSRPYMPFMTRSSSTTAGFWTKYRSSARHAVFRFEHLVAGRLEDAAGAPPGQARIVDDQDFARS